MILIQKARFAPGQMVVHRSEGYLGLIFDLDPIFEPDGVSITRESQADRPWYHILVDGQDEPTYVSETDLRPVEYNDGFSHPLTDALFEHTSAGDVVSRYSVN